jgi:hypothetical protein
VTRGVFVGNLKVTREVVKIVSARGGKYGFVYTSRHKAYRRLRSKGMSKTQAARIANRGRTFAGRSAMARKGWAGRRRKR